MTEAQSTNNNSHRNLKVIDHYEYFLDDIIGSGQFSNVYKGTDTINNSTVAIKVLSKNDDNQLNKLIQENEIRTLVKISDHNNQNLLKVHKILYTANNIYIISEMCSHGDLKNALEKQKKVKESIAIKILKHILNGVTELYSRGFIHRDVKPANILIEQGIPKIADFGFCIPIEELKNLDPNHLNMGTPLYMPPESFIKNQYNLKCDVWSIGVLFYELVHGKTPFDTQNETELKIMMKNVDQIQYIDTLSDISKQFIQNCLQVDPNKRPSIKQIATHPILNKQTISQIQERDEQQQDQKKYQEAELKYQEGQEKFYKSCQSKINNFLAFEIPIQEIVASQIYFCVFKMKLVKRLSLLNLNQQQNNFYWGNQVRKDKLLFTAIKSLGIRMNQIQQFMHQRQIQDTKLLKFYSQVQTDAIIIFRQEYQKLCNSPIFLSCLNDDLRFDCYFDSNMKGSFPFHDFKMKMIKQSIKILYDSLITTFNSNMAIILELLITWFQYSDMSVDWKLFHTRSGVREFINVEPPEMKAEDMKRIRQNLNILQL